MQTVFYALLLAQNGVIATGSGRGGAVVAGVIALAGVIVGGVAFSRSARGNARDGAIVSLVLAVIGALLAVLHLVTARGGIGTGNGRAGAIVALVLGVAGVVLGRLAIRRSGR